MSWFNNDVRVANTATPSFQSSANVGQFGWTGADQGHYNQLIQYVDECRKIWLDMQDKIAYVEEILSTVKDVDAQVKYMEQMTYAVQGWRSEVMSARSQVQTMHDNLIPLINDFNTKYPEFSNMHSDVVTLHKETVEAQHAAVSAEVEAIKAAQEAKDVAEELRKGQVYRGTWNIEENARYPDKPDTNSVWDVTLKEGSLEYSFDNTRWFWGDRILYLKDEDKFSQIESGSTVISVNGKSGAITLNAADVGAVNKDGDTMSGALFWENDSKFISQSDQNLHFAARNGTAYIESKLNPIARVGGMDYNFYHTGNMPTPSAIGAVSKTGDTLTGDLNMHARLIMNNQVFIGANNAPFLRDHGNGNVTLSASVNSAGTPGELYLGYNAALSGTAGYNTSNVRLQAQLNWQNLHTLVNTSGLLNSERLYGAIRVDKDAEGIYHTIIGGDDTLNRGRTIIASGESGKMVAENTLSGTEAVHISGDQNDGVFIHTGVQNGYGGTAHYQYRFNQGNIYSKRMDGTVENRFFHEGYIPTAVQVGALPIAGGTLTGNLTVTGQHQVRNAANTYGARIVDSSGTIYYQGGKTDQTTDDQKVAIGGWMGKGLSSFTIQMAEGYQPVARIGANNYNIYHQGYRPSAADVSAVALSGNSTINGSLEISNRLTMNGTGNVIVAKGGFVRSDTDSVMSLDGREYSFVTSTKDAHLCYNSYWNGAAWKKYNDAQPSGYVVVREQGLEYAWSAAGDTNPHVGRAAILAGHNTGFVSANGLFIPDASNGWSMEDHAMLAYVFPGGCELRGILRRTAGQQMLSNVLGHFVHPNCKIPYSIVHISTAIPGHSPDGWGYIDQATSGNVVTSNAYNSGTGWVMINLRVQFI